ncbi:MAG: ATP-binding cassette domain-containing protein [Candidatus Firestonebacteria bacterium]
MFNGKNANKNIFKNRQTIVTVFQEPLLLNNSVYNNVALGLKLRKINKKEIEKMVQPWLSILGIEYLKHKNVKKISKGESQRVNLARAFVIKPKLILLDEPFSTLDTPTKNELLYDPTSAV